MNETSTPAAVPADPQANTTDLLVARLAEHGAGRSARLAQDKSGR